MAYAYLVGNITVKDADKWAEYRHEIPETLVPWGAELVFRGKQVAALAGHSPHTDIVVIRFPDIGSLDAWYASAAYQAIIPLRQQAADVVLTSYVE
jgi:uncharacterized protein (DUF1330 family)